MKVLLALSAAVVVSFGCKDSGDNSARTTAKDGEVYDAGASKAPERTVVTGVEVKVVDPSKGPERELYPRELAKRIGATLTESEWFLGDGDEVGAVTPRRALVEVMVGYSIVEEGSEGTPAVIAVIEAAIKYEDGAASLQPQMNILAERGFTKDERSNLDGIVAEHVQRAAADAAAGLIAKERIRVGPPKAAIEALGSDDLDARTWALAVIGDRKIADAFDEVVARLEAEREEERDAAIGALLALKDPRAVAPLTRLAEFSDHALMRRVIDAVASLGGDEALDYLEFVASGHPKEDIKRQAAEALRRLQRR